MDSINTPANPMHDQSVTFDSQPMLNPPDMARILNIMGHELRLKILWFLIHHQHRSVSQMQEYLAVEQSLLSHHLVKMYDRGLLTNERIGKRTLYSIAPQWKTLAEQCLDLMEPLSPATLQEA